MLIEIPDDLARKAKRQMTLRRHADECRSDAARAESQDRPIAAVLDLMYAALIEADLPEPVRVGHLATLDDSADEVLVTSFDGQTAWVRDWGGWWKEVRLRDLTYSRPKPEGWGEQ